MELTTPPLPMELATPHLPQELTTPLLPQELATPSLPLDLSTSPLPPPLASSGRCETALPAPLPPSLPNTGEPQTGGASVVPLVQSDPLSVQSDIAGTAYGNPLELLRPFLTPEYGRSDLHDLSKILLSLTTGFTGYGTNYLTTSALSTESTPFSATTGGNSGSESDVSSDDSDSTGLKNSFDRLQPPRKRRRPSPLHPSPPPTLTVVRGRAKHLQQCVEHDHCYAMTSGQPRGRRSGSEGDVSVEEENSSDPGKAYMYHPASMDTRVYKNMYTSRTVDRKISTVHHSCPLNHEKFPVYDIFIFTHFVYTTNLQATKPCRLSPLRATEALPVDATPSPPPLTPHPLTPPPHPLTPPPHPPPLPLPPPPRFPFPFLPSAPL